MAPTDLTHVEPGTSASAARCGGNPWREEFADEPFWGGVCLFSCACCVLFAFHLSHRDLFSFGGDAWRHRKQHSDWIVLRAGWSSEFPGPADRHGRLSLSPHDQR